MSASIRTIRLPANALKFQVTLQGALPFVFSLLFRPAFLDLYLSILLESVQFASWWARFIAELNAENETFSYPN